MPIIHRSFISKCAPAILLIAGALLLCATEASAKKKPKIAPSYAWETSAPLGDMTKSTIDTTFINYAANFVPSLVSDAWATTGNYGAEGENMIWSERAPRRQFYFIDPLTPWIPALDSYKFYNTRIPMTLVSYNFGGSRDNSLDRLKGVFSGNVNKPLQFGAYIDYLYSKGSYNSQAVKDFTYGFSSSYLGDRYKMQASMFHYNLLNKENGGLQDVRVITQPDSVNINSNTGNPKYFNTNLNNAHTRVRGLDLFVNNRYSLGYTHVERADTDTIDRKTFIPVTDLILTLQYKDDSHVFQRKPTLNDKDGFFPATYYDKGYTYDRTTWSEFAATAGIGLIEGFHSWVKAGLTGFLTYERTSLRLPSYAASGTDLTPLPANAPLADKYTKNKVYVGGQLRSTKSKYFNYDVTGKLGIAGAPGEFDIDGTVNGSIPLLSDTLAITAFGAVRNHEPSQLMKTYRSNHWVWNNNFSNYQSLRIGGRVNFRTTGTAFELGTETLRNYIYFDNNALPAQASTPVQILWATLDQKLNAGPVHWDNRLTYQTTTNENVVPLPTLTLFSNLYVFCRVAKVLQVQAGLNADYYTRYKAPGYRPETMAFYNQNKKLIGNYPVANLYVNMKLSRTTFYVMLSHINQGLGWWGNNYFSMPNYPLNPRRLQMGLLVDFAD